MGAKVTVVLPLDRTTPGALVYAVKPMTSQIVGQVYVRKDKLLEAGHTGPWPNQITVTVEAE